MIRWPAEAIWQAVHPLLSEFSVEILPQIDSTNTELMRRARAGRLEPVLLVAERQTAGRGRLGRVWKSENRPLPAASSAQEAESASTVVHSLTFSLGLLLAPADWWVQPWPRPCTRTSASNGPTTCGGMTASLPAS